MRRPLAVLAAVLVAACGRSATSSTTATRSIMPHPTPAPSAHSAAATFDLLLPAGVPPSTDLQISCSRPIGSSDPVAIVRLHDGSTVLRDYSDVNHPYSACTFGASFITQLIDAHHVVIPGQGASLFAVVDLPEVRVHWFQLPTPPGFPSLLAVAPGLDAVAWMSVDLPSNTDQIHLTTHGGDNVVTSLPNPHGGRCGGPDDSKAASYTQSGRHLFVRSESPSIIDVPVAVWPATSSNF